MKVNLCLICVALSVALPGWALAWRGDNYNTVNPVSDAVFEVVGKPGSDDVDYWCSAGDYALRVLGARVTQRVYIVRGMGAAETSNSKSAVQFSLVEPLPARSAAETAPDWGLSVTQIGANLIAASAQSYCLDRKNLEF